MGFIKPVNRVPLKIAAPCFVYICRGTKTSRFLSWNTGWSTAAGVFTSCFMSEKKSFLSAPVGGSLAVHNEISDLSQVDTISSNVSSHSACPAIGETSAETKEAGRQTERSSDNVHHSRLTSCGGKKMDVSTFVFFKFHSVPTLTKPVMTTFSYPTMLAWAVTKHTEREK